MDVTRQELIEAERQIDSTLRKLQKVSETLRTKEKTGRYQSQITLAERRIQAFSIARGEPRLGAYKRFSGGKTLVPGELLPWDKIQNGPPQKRKLLWDKLAG